jgi:glycosyltransferase involved in cell wall biosynthesis
LEPQKRFDLLIEAVVALRDSQPNLRLLIAGHGSLDAALRQQIDALGAGNMCRLLGHQRDIPRLHHAFDLFVQASDYEGTPNAVLEAMAMGTPVVATAAGGTAEMMEDNVQGLVIPCGSAQAIAHAISRMIGDPESRVRVAAAARRHVEGPLSFSARMRKVEAVYREMCRPAQAVAQATTLHA